MDSKKLKAQHERSKRKCESNGKSKSLFSFANKNYRPTIQEDNKIVFQRVCLQDVRQEQTPMNMSNTLYKFDMSSKDTSVQKRQQNQENTKVSSL